MGFSDPLLKGANMKHAAQIWFALFLGSMTAYAQNSSYGVGQIENLNDGVATQSKTVVLLPPGMGCPIGMRVRQGIATHLSTIDQDGRRSPGFAQRLRLTLTNPQSKRITGATVTVHGRNAKGRIVHASSADDSSSELTKTLNVRFADGSGGSVSTDLLLPGFTSARSIYLNSVTYADGSTWRFNADENCHAAPDPLMLVGDR